MATNQRQMPRYRAWYTVYRPDDIRLKITPKRYISDQQYVSPDHHEWMDDAPTTMTPPVKFRTQRDRLAGHGYPQ
uniref:Uncharacterized protein n=1 Tax=Tetranychus urticae TaxID=32264 RepID=T1JXH6_TETUR